MKSLTFLSCALLVLLVPAVYAYPPAVGILGNAKDCLACHINNGPWMDEENTIIDILDKETKISQKQADGTFKLEVKRGEAKFYLTVIGRTAGDAAAAPYRNAWLYIDQSMIGNSSLSKFPAGWEINLPMACRLTGDNSDAYPGAKITVLPFTIRAGENAENAQVELQVMLTRGDAVKGKAKEGMEGNYFERIVNLQIK